MSNPLETLLTPLLAPDFQRIEEYLQHYAKTNPNEEACIDENQRLTYRALNQQVNLCAAALLEKGVQPGDFVATHAPPSIDFWITFLATQVCGATWVGINPKYQKEEIAYILKETQPKVIFARITFLDRDYLADFLAIKKELNQNFELIALDNPPLNKHFKSYVDFINIKTGIKLPINPSPNSMIVFTSGSTGQPKGALLPHLGLIQGARIRYTVWHRQAMRTLFNLPINHIGGAGDIACTTLIGGGTLVCMSKFNPLKTLQIIEKEKLTFLYQIPTQLQMVFSLPETINFDLSSLKAVVWSGARASKTLIDKLASLFPKKLGTDYSMTESIGAVCMTPLTEDKAVLGNSVGWKVPGRKVNIHSESKEILLQDAFFMTGYHNRSAATEATIINGELHTGDKGQQLPNGTIQLIGRMSQMYKSGGYNVYPAEIEKVLEGHELIAAAIVLSRPDELWGEIGHAFLEVNKNTAIQASEIESYCRTKLANYKIPKGFTVLKEFPKLAIGKVDRAALKKLLVDYKVQK